MGLQYDILVRSADLVAQRLGRAPLGVVLGSGLSEVLDNLERQRFMDYADIPGLAEPGVVGHRGTLLHGYIGDIPLLALCGRVHLYEDRPLEDVTAPVRLLSLLGVHTLIVTSAVSSLDEKLPPGHVVLVEDHINLSGRNVLMGEHDPKFGDRFLDLTAAYDLGLMEAFEATARLAKVPISRGVLAQFLGPTYETAAEIRMARSLGAQVASLSMVPDVVLARQRRMRVAGLASVTHVAAGLAPGPLRHDDVLINSARGATTLQTLLSGTLPRLLGSQGEHRPAAGLKAARPVDGASS